MNDYIKYPIGIQTFDKIREGKYLYVDKTALVYDLVNRNEYVFLSRPRRFGKSLLLSTIEAYFQGRRDLFRGLAIEKLESTWEKFPVFRASLASSSYESPENLLNMIDFILKGWEAQYGAAEGVAGIGPRFSAVIKKAWEHTGQKVVILIDEYDKPLLEKLHDDEAFELFRDQLRGFYSVIKDSDEYIRFAMLTGVTKFGHLSVFSGLNNLKDISMNPRFNALCGITESEFRSNFEPSVANFCHATGMEAEEVWDSFRANYDGYLFSERGEGIYNPFSVLYAFDDAKIGSYWFRTGTPTFVVNLLKKNNTPLWNLEGLKKTEAELQDMTLSVNNLIPLLYQSGYLTIKDYERETQRYILGFPNLEVKHGFWDALYKGYIQPSTGVDTSYILDCFVDEVRGGQPERFMERLKALVASVSPGNSGKREIHFQNELQVIFKMLGFRVQCEVVSSYGRADMIVQTPDYVYIFEFKLDSTAEAALEQIKEKGYAAPFAADSRKLFLIGATFTSGSCSLGDYIVE